MDDEDVIGFSNEQLDATIGEIDEVLEDFDEDAAQWEADGVLEG